MRFLLLLLGLVSVISNAESINCVSEVRHFCNDFEPCVKNIDKNKSTYFIEFSPKNITIVKKIGENETSTWKAKLVNKRFDGTNTYFENSGALTMLTINASKSHFVLLMPGADKNSAWSQVEIGKCK